MPKCPHCKKDIETLDHWQAGVNTYDFWVEDGDPEYQHQEFNAADGDEQAYDCPECGQEIAHDEADAIGFFEGDKNGSGSSKNNVQTK